MYKTTDIKQLWNNKSFICKCCKCSYIQSNVCYINY